MRASYLGGAQFVLRTNSLHITNSTVADIIRTAGTINSYDLFGGGGSSQLTLYNGSQTFTSDMGASGAAVDVTVNAGADLKFGSTQHLHSLNISSGATAEMIPAGGQVRWAANKKLLGGRVKPASLDSSLFESRHVSRHFEKRQRQSRRQEVKRARKTREKAAANRRRSRVVRGLPKLSLAVDTASHLILAARATTGGGSDAPHFKPLLVQANQRAGIRIVVADSGYDSEANHVVARELADADAQFGCGGVPVAVVAGKRCEDPLAFDVVHGCRRVGVAARMRGGGRLCLRSGSGLASGFAAAELP